MSESTPKEVMGMIKRLSTQDLYTLLEKSEASFSYCMTASLVCAEILKRQRKEGGKV